MDSFTIPSTPKITGREFKQHHRLISEDVDNTYKSFSFDELKKYLIQQTTLPTLFTVPIQSVDYIDETTVNLCCNLPSKYFGLIPNDSLMVAFYYKKESESSWTKTDGQLITSLPSGIVKHQISGLNAFEYYEFKATLWDDSNPSMEYIANTVKFKTRYLTMTTTFKDIITYDFSQGELNNVVASSDVLQLSANQSSGYRIRPIIDLSVLTGIFDNIVIESTQTTPSGTSIKTEVSVSNDNGNTWGEYEEVINDTITQLKYDSDITNTQIKIKQTLETNNTSITPFVDILEISVMTVSNPKSIGPGIKYPYDQAVMTSVNGNFECDDNPDVVSTEWRIIDIETGLIVYETETNGG